MIIIQNLSKLYEKNTPALNNITFSIQPGEFIGLIGSNGAGKTTLLRILATLITPTSGSVKIKNKDIILNPQVFREKIGYIPENNGCYRRFTARWNLDFYAKCYKTNFSQENIFIENLLARLSLSKHLDLPVGKFSKGMQQKLALVRGLLHNPELLLLDEPLNGLDVESRNAFKIILKELQNEKKTIILSSHILADIYDICDRLIIIEAGTILLDQKMVEIHQYLSSFNGKLTLENYYLEIIQKYAK